MDYSARSVFQTSRLTVPALVISPLPQPAARGIINFETEAVAGTGAFDGASQKPRRQPRCGSEVVRVFFPPSCSSEGFASTDNACVAFVQRLIGFRSLLHSAELAVNLQGLAIKQLRLWIGSQPNPRGFWCVLTATPYLQRTNSFSHISRYLKNTPLLSACKREWLEADEKHSETSPTQTQIRSGKRQQNESWNFFRPCQTYSSDRNCRLSHRSGSHAHRNGLTCSGLLLQTDQDQFMAQILANAGQCQMAIFERACHQLRINKAVPLWEVACRSLPKIYVENESRVSISIGSQEPVLMAPRFRSLLL